MSKNAGKKENPHHAANRSKKSVHHPMRVVGKAFKLTRLSAFSDASGNTRITTTSTRSADLTERCDFSTLRDPLGSI